MTDTLLGLHTLPKAILFDNDGVLSASEPLHWEAWRLLLKDHGLPYDEPLIRALVGKTAPEIMAAVLDRFCPGWDPAHYDLKALALKKNDYFLRIAQSGLAVYPGVSELLSWLKQKNVKVAVVSNAKQRELDAALAKLDLDRFLDLKVSRDEPGLKPKPDPSMYLFAAASLGLEPHQCLAVEDSPPGLEAALTGKIPTAAVMTNFKREALQSPVPGRADLRPVWIGESIQALFERLREVAS